MIKLIVAFIFSGLSIEMCAQGNPDNKPKVNFDLSIINRTVVDLTYSFSPASRVMHDRQLSGTGINYGFQLYFPKWEVGLKGAQSLRYDHIFFEQPANNPGLNYAKEVKGFIFDYHFDIQKFWNFEKWSLSTEVGVSLMNTGTDYSYANIVSPTPGGANSYGFKDSRFNAYNFTVGGHIQNLLISLGAFYTSNAYNYPNAPSLLIPEAKIGYSFKVVR